MTLLLCSISPDKFLGLSGAEFSVPVTRPRQLGSPSPPLPDKEEGGGLFQDLWCLIYLRREKAEA